MGKHVECPKDVVFRPIGIIHSALKKKEETPIQPVYARGIKGSVEIFDEYTDGLHDLEGFSHIYLLYHFHKAGDVRLVVRPFVDDMPRGVFATRAPCRPNPIGVSLVRLNQIRGDILDIEDIDVLDGTPLLDIKPYISRFDSRDSVRCGWQENVDEETAKLRGRRNFLEEISKT